MALVLFTHLFNGFTNTDLRSNVATFLPANNTYKTNQMTYDLRRLRLKGIIVRLPKSNRYILTPYGRKVAIFFSKVDGQLFGHEFVTINQSNPVPKTLSHAFLQVDQALEHLRDQIGLRKAS